MQSNNETKAQPTNSLGMSPAVTPAATYQPLVEIITRGSRRWMSPIEYSTVAEIYKHPGIVCAQRTIMRRPGAWRAVAARVTDCLPGPVNNK